MSNKISVTQLRKALKSATYPDELRTVTIGNETFEFEVKGELTAKEHMEAVVEAEKYYEASGYNSVVHDFVAPYVVLKRYTNLPIEALDKEGVNLAWRLTHFVDVFDLHDDAVLMMQEIQTALYVTDSKIARQSAADKMCVAIQNFFEQISTTTPNDMQNLLNLANSYESLNPVDVAKQIMLMRNDENVEVTNA